MTKLEPQLTIRQEMQIDQAATAGIVPQRIAELVSTKEAVVTVGQVLACVEDTRKFRAEQEALERDFEARK